MPYPTDLYFSRNNNLIAVIKYDYTTYRRGCWTSDVVYITLGIKNRNLPWRRIHKSKKTFVFGILCR